MSVASPPMPISTTTAAGRTHSMPWRNAAGLPEASNITSK